MCDKRTATLIYHTTYDDLWDKIMQLIPQLEENIKFIMSDFEMAAVKSLSQKFPRAKLSGCWFHFNQVFNHLSIIFNVLCVYIAASAAVSKISSSRTGCLGPSVTLYICIINMYCIYILLNAYNLKDIDRRVNEHQAK